jgi:hypothetical protein
MVAYISPEEGRRRRRISRRGSSGWSGRHKRPRCRSSPVGRVETRNRYQGQEHIKPDKVLLVCGSNGALYRLAIEIFHNKFG